MIFKKFFVDQKYPEKLEKLYRLVYNLWWSWNYEAIHLFYRIDAQLFRKLNHNPVKLLYSLPRERLEELSRDKGFLFELDKVWQIFEEYNKYSASFKAAIEKAAKFTEKDTVAFFSMEYGLHESIPIYAGGLGIFSGDFLQSASDMGLPLVGVGLLYKYGYFTQSISLDGQQEEVFVEFKNHLMPIRELRDKKGQPVYIEVALPKGTVKVKLWSIDVGKVKLILLDTDLEDNPPDLRGITNELYVADMGKRIQQELVLGLGGVRALRTLGIEPRIYHLNDAHPAFIILERLRHLIGEKKFSMPEARMAIRASTVFTTHTTVIAGNENFKTEFAKKYLDREAKTLGLTFDQLASFGFIGEEGGVFWLPALIIRFSGHINAVSRQHRDVASKIWAPLFPERPQTEIPIDYVANGVHRQWVSENFIHIYNRYLGPGYIHYVEKDEIWERIFDIPDEEIWQAHRNNKILLISFARKKLAEDSAAKRHPKARTLKLMRVLNPEYLTVVFARRFTPYKRPNLILRDKKRLKEILTNPERPVQLIFAGKAHPADQQGKDMIREVLEFASEYEVEDRVIFLENYDINVARFLIWGADVWLNTPTEGMEASGTSGIKAAMNGVLNLSMLEGWWREGFNGKNGWAITGGESYSHSELREASEANQIYNLFEEEITLLYYERGETPFPRKWIAKMKESMCSVSSKFNMNRTLHEYVKKLYTPSIKEVTELAGNDYKLLRETAVFEKEVLKYWGGLKFNHFSTTLDKKARIREGDTVKAECRINLGEAPPEIFKVEICYILDEAANVRIIPMKLREKSNGEGRYSCDFKIQGYGLQGINARIKPADEFIEGCHPELIKWKD